MVLADKNSGETNVKNGRSRGPSPNTAANNGATHESTSDDEGPEDRIRVGRDYQAICPPLQPTEHRRPDLLPDHALLVWSPTVDIPETQHNYIRLAKDKYGYNGEQALGMLFWHKHDLDHAMQDLANFTPFPDEWSVEDKVLFEQAFQFHGKSFHRIRQMLPDKTIASLVKYYYSWKKTRTRTSLLDKQVRRGNSDEMDVDNKNGETSVATAPSASNVDADVEQRERDRGVCGNCGISCSITHASTKGQQLCFTCLHHWRRTGSARPISGPGRRYGGWHGHAIMRHKRKPPHGMHINHDDLVIMAAAQPHILLRGLDRKIESLRTTIQINKQDLEEIKDEATDDPGIVLDEINELPAMKSNSKRHLLQRWTNDEVLLTIEAIRKYGKNFKAVSEIVGTKSESHVRGFFIKYRRKYNLDDIVKAYEASCKNTVKHDGNMEATIDLTDNDDVKNEMDPDVEIVSLNELQ